MKLSTHALTVKTLAILLLAGTCSPAEAQQTEPGVMPGASGSESWIRTADYRSCHWLKGREVTNAENKEIAQVTDLIMDRGSGRIAYLVLKTGDFLGMGGKSVALPYGAFRWLADDKSIGLDASAEDLKKCPEFSADEWTAMMESRKDKRSDLFDRMDSESDALNDPYHDSLKGSSSSTITGRVESVNRVRTSSYGEQIELVVKTADGATRRVALGPSWFVGGSSVAPSRGDTVEIDTLDLARDKVSTATRIRIGERDLRLRESDGSPAWRLKSVGVDGKSYNTPYWRYVLLSNVRGMRIDCHGNECGKVADVIVERHSGTVAFLSIDPNQNFLGIGDTKRLVPWSVATVALDGTVRIDASKEMVTSSPETPSDLSTLATGSRAEMIYNAYQVPMPRFEAPRPTSATPPITNNAWSPDGVIMKSIDRDSLKPFKGEVADFTEQRFGAGIPPARVIVIKTSSGDERVIVGPAWYMNEQRIPCHKGEPVTVEAYRTNIDGQSYWIARSIESKSSRVALWNKGSDPVWHSR